MKPIRLVLTTLGATAALAAISSNVLAHDGVDHKANTTMDHSKMGDMKGMKMSNTGDADVDFATNMRMHHQMGLKMAQEELKSGKDADAKAMAQKIIEAQTKEIAEFDEWLAKHKVGAATAKKQ